MVHHQRLAVLIHNLGRIFRVFLPVAEEVLEVLRAHLQPLLPRFEVTLLTVRCLAKILAFLGLCLNLTHLISKAEPRLVAACHPFLISLTACLAVLRRRRKNLDATLHEKVSHLR